MGIHQHVPRCSRLLFTPFSPFVGDWLLLKNLHLVVSWLPLLEKEVHNLPADRHASFRLFLTSEPHVKFTATLLEGAFKVRTLYTYCKRLLCLLEPGLERVLVLLLLLAVALKLLAKLHDPFSMCCNIVVSTNNCVLDGLVQASLQMFLEPCYWA